MSLIEWPEWLDTLVLGYKLSQWGALFGIVFVSFLFRNLSKYLLGVLKLFVKKTKTQWDDRVVEAIEKPFVWVFLGAVCYLSVNALDFEGTTLTIFTVLAQALFSYGVIFSLYRLSNVLVAFLDQWAQQSNSELDVHLLPLLGKSLKVFVVLGGVLVALQNIGVNVYSLVAGLGIGGLAFALAAKDTAANFFGSVMILLDRPFTVGDWVKFGDYEGTVEEISFRSTRIRTFYDSQVYVPNSIVANKSTDNMGRRRYRRAVAKLGVTYDTSPEKLEAFLEGIKNIIRANEFTRKDYFHVVFNQYGDFNLEVMLYFFLEVPDWSRELVERQNIFIEIYRLANQLGVEFAFPTQTLHVENSPKKENMKMSDSKLKEMAKSFSFDGKASKAKGLGIFTPPYQDS